MKVLLLKDVGGLGKRDQVKEVSDGYALNYLLPHHLAERADSKNIFQAKQRQAAEQNKTIRRQQIAEQWRQKLAGRVLKLSAKAATTGKLYRAITPDEIVQAIKEQFKVNLTGQEFNNLHQLKSLGEHPLEIKLTGLNPIIMTINITLDN